MNDELTKIALESGAPAEVMDQLWFHIFCMKFADRLLTLTEQEIFDRA